MSIHLNYGKKGDAHKHKLSMDTHTELSVKH